MKIERKSGPRRVLDLETDYVVEDRGHETPCWIWQGDTEKNGYGRIYRDGRRHKAHRFVYEQIVGPIPRGHNLHHECEQPPCVRPDHLTPKKQGDHFNGHRSAKWYESRKPKSVPAYVPEMRELYATGQYTFQQLGEEFGVSRQTAHKIVRRQRYA